ncbi:MAG: ParA family protein [Actinomycetes bacterium]
MDDSRETLSETATRKVVGVRRLKEPMSKPEKTRIFTVANQKGGVGKTTSAVNIAAALAMGGLRTLVIDLDPQGNACTALGIDRNDVPGMYQVLVKDQSLATVIQKVAGFPHLDCAPADRELAGAEINMVGMVARESRLKIALNGYLSAKELAGERIDYVLIDCPPSLGLLTVNALTAASEVLVPIQCEYYSLEGLTLLLETLNQIQQILNPVISITTIILTMFDSRTRLANDVANSVRQFFPKELIDIPIPRAVRISEAPSFNQTVMTYDPSSPGAVAYMGVAREIAQRAQHSELIKEEPA